VAPTAEHLRQHRWPKEREKERETPFNLLIERETRETRERQEKGEERRDDSGSRIL
jgi:hypothetical protein